MRPVGVNMAVCHVAHPVELLLQFFVGVVDAELFEAVPLKRLEPAPTEKSSCQIDLCSHNCYRLTFLPPWRHKADY